MTDGEVSTIESVILEPIPAEGYVDYEHRQYISPVGVRLTLKPLSKLVLERLYNNQDGKPKVPVVEVEIGGTYKAKESNPNDPKYKEALAQWTSDKNIGLTRYLIDKGILETPPDEFIEETRIFSPQVQDRDLKYLWVLSLLGETDEAQTASLKVLTEAMFGQVAPTEEGMRQAEESFRSNGGGHTPEPVPDGQVAG